jgi:probable HAF family extracellular repeat protein
MCDPPEVLPGFRRNFILLSVSEDVMRRYFCYRFGLALSQLMLFAVVTVQPAEAQNPAYTVTDLGTFGGARSAAFSINNSGQVAGFAETADGRSQAFVYISGTLFNLGTLGGAHSYASRISDSGFVIGRANNASGNNRAFVTILNGSMFDISSLDSRLGGSFSVALGVNGLGQVVGYFHTSDEHMASQNRVFVYSDHQVTDLGTFGGADGIVTAINDSGQMAGSYGTEPKADYSERTAFLYSGGKVINLGTLGGKVTVATDLNNTGQVVGYSQTRRGDYHACIYSGGALTDLGVLPGGSHSLAYGINNSGQVVGASDSAKATLHAFVYSGGQMRDLNSLIPANSSWELTEAREINNAGQIVGNGIKEGQQRGFLLTPIVK